MRKGVVSVVLPIYNVEKYLNRCIKSVINQSYKNLEIILVDDGSPDNCPTLCDEWAKKDNRIKVIHKKNAGVSSARNTGITKSTGDYICFVDGDDYVMPEYIDIDEQSRYDYSLRNTLYAGIFNGYEDMSLRLQNNLTRAEAAAVFVRLAGYLEGLD